MHATPTIHRLLVILIITGAALVANDSVNGTEPEKPTPAATMPPGGLGLQLPTPSPSAPSVAESTTPQVTPSSAVENSVVKVFASARYPDLAKPWTKQAPTEVTGSGVIIEGKRILTNAHVVLFASEVQVQANQAGDKISATVEAIAPGIDLAVLKVDEEKFFESHLPLVRAEKIPAIKDAVMVYGYPTGGSSLSITKGIVSRIEFAPYNFPVSGLRIQIDAAINPGNSGGPAVDGDKMIGLAFSHLGGAENIGYIIPCEEIELFLKDIADGHYDGKPGLFDEFQTLENPALRSFLKLDPSIQGIIVHKPMKADASYPLKEWDVITKIGDTSIDDEGMIKLGSSLRIRFPYLVQKITRNGKLPLTIVRGNREVHIDLPVSPDYPLVIPEWKGNYPPYFVFGPLVFSEATAQVVAGLSKVPKGAEWVLALIYMGNPLITRYGDKPAFDGERVVFVSSPFFPHKLAKGYANPSLKVVKTINHQAVKNLKHLIELLRDTKEEFVTIEFADRASETFVLPRKEAIAATETILTDNGVRTQGSPEMLAVWTAQTRH
ncbi:MAG: serine protease [Verrucomicrobia bacterium]|nr:MAG: serine protease [Verrucomicrobiota bacterium]